MDSKERSQMLFFMPRKASNGTSANSNAVQKYTAIVNILPRWPVSIHFILILYFENFYKGQIYGNSESAFSNESNTAVSKKPIFKSNYW